MVESLSGESIRSMTSVQTFLVGNNYVNKKKKIFLKTSGPQCNASLHRTQCKFTLTSLLHCLCTK